MSRWIIVGVAAAVAVLLGVTFASALPNAVVKERLGRQRALGAVCQQVLRPEPKVDALGGVLPQPAPDFKLKDHAGREIALSQYRGRVVLVNFWATWCPTCVVEMPSLERLQESMKGRDFSLLAVSVDEKWDDVRRFFQKGTQMTVLLDEDKATPRRWGTDKFPETFIVDKEGRVRFYVISDRDWSSDGMKTCIDALIDE